MRLGGGLTRFVERAGTTNIALQNDDGETWTYGDVRIFLESMNDYDMLHGRRVGICINDRMKGGLLSLGAMNVSSCIPINPEYSDQEIRTALEVHQIEILLTDAANLADRLELAGIQVGFVKINQKKLSLEWKCEPRFFTSETSQPGLILQTSGSTGEPKAVKLRSENLLHSVKSIITSLELSSSDVCLNSLPMVHVGGLVDLLLAPLFAGGQVIFSNPKDTHGIHQLIQNGSLTWIQGPPTLLASILSQVSTTTEHRLRFIRSVSAPLSNDLFENLEAAFKIPVIEIYGMSETAGVITSNSLPPGKRKPGSVGIPVNCEIQARDSGDIWVRGQNVFQGYAPAYRDSPDWDGDWFNTGDVGHIDDEGYLFLSGRSKEQINRGGQKVSPREIDLVVEAWPEIKEAAAFGVDHTTLGEEVSLAYVLETGTFLEETEIKQRLSTVLAPFKCPKTFRQLTHLPRNQGGKLQRHLLKSQPNIKSSTTANLTGATEHRIARIWKSLLKLNDIEAEDDFYELGGDSLSAASLMKQLEKEFSISLQALVFYENTTVRALSSFIDETVQNQNSRAIQSEEIKIPKRLRKKLEAFIFAWEGIPSFPGALCREIPESGADPTERVFWCANNKIQFEGIRKALEGEFQVIGFRTLQRIQKRYFRNYPLLVETYANHIERIQPDGDYVLGGFCEGGKIMIEVAELLKARGKTIRHLILNDYIHHTPIDAYVSMVFSKEWKHNPLMLWSNPHLAWQKVFGNNYGMMPWDGDHQSHDSKAFQSAFRSFICNERDQATISPNSLVKRINPHCSIRPISKIPRWIKRSKSYPAKFQVTNLGSDPIKPDQGILLHARWADLDRTKGGVKMHTPLTKVLNPGESQDLELTIRTMNKIRYHRIQVCMLEEGQAWPDGEQQFQQWITIY